MDTECQFLVASTVAAAGYIFYNVMRDEKEKATWPGPPGTGPTPRKDKIHFVRVEEEVKGEKILRTYRKTHRDMTQKLHQIMERKAHREEFPQPNEILAQITEVEEFNQEFPAGAYHDKIKEENIVERLQEFMKTSQQFHEPQLQTPAKYMPPP